MIYIRGFLHNFLQNVENEVIGMEVLEPIYTGLIKLESHTRLFSL